jgi:hypothetical protein
MIISFSLFDKILNAPRSSMVFSNEQGREEIARPYGSISNECNLMDYP